MRSRHLQIWSPTWYVIGGQYENIEISYVILEWVVSSFKEGRLHNCSRGEAVGNWYVNLGHPFSRVTPEPGLQFHVNLSFPHHQFASQNLLCFKSNWWCGIARLWDWREIGALAQALLWKKGASNLYSNFLQPPTSFERAYDSLLRYTFDWISGFGICLSPLYPYHLL